MTDHTTETIGLLSRLFPTERFYPGQAKGAIQCDNFSILTKRMCDTLGVQAFSMRAPGKKTNTLYIAADTDAEILRQAMAIEAIGYLNQYCAGENFYLRGEHEICCDGPNAATRHKIKSMGWSHELVVPPEVIRGTFRLIISQDFSNPQNISDLKACAEKEETRKSTIISALPDMNAALDCVSAMMVPDQDKEYLISEHIPYFRLQSHMIADLLEKLHNVGVIGDFVFDEAGRMISIFSVNAEKLKSYLGADSKLPLDPRQPAATKPFQPGIE